MLEHGDDLDIARDIEFFFLFTGEAEALAFHDQVVVDPTLRAEVSVNEHNGWQVMVVRHMKPAHSAINELEAQLTDSAQAYGGKADGWGCMQPSLLH